jgi:hypothetical protein
MVGNGCTDEEYDGNALPPFAVGKSLISQVCVCLPGRWVPLMKIRGQHDARLLEGRVCRHRIARAASGTQEQRARGAARPAPRRMLHPSISAYVAHVEAVTWGRSVKSVLQSTPLLPANLPHIA